MCIVPASRGRPHWGQFIEAAPFKKENASVPRKRQRRNILCGTTLLAAGKDHDHSSLPGNGGVRRRLLSGKPDPTALPDSALCSKVIFPSPSCPPRTGPAALCTIQGWILVLFIACFYMQLISYLLFRGMSRGMEQHITLILSNLQGILISFSGKV